MDLETTLLWFALAGGVVTFITGLRTWRAGDRVYLASGAIILAITGLVFLARPAASGIAGSIAWAVLVLAPNFLSRGAARAAGRREHRWAIRLTQAVYALHPSASVRQLLRDRRAALDMYEGRFGSAEEALRASAPKDGPERHVAELSCLRIQGDWEGTLAYFDAHVRDDDALRYPLLLHSYLRALGELGRRRELVRTYARFAARLEGQQRQPHRVGAWLFLFAFAGERDLVDRLFKRLLGGHPQDLSDLWTLTADLAAGRPMPEGTAARLEASKDAAVRAMMQRRRANAEVLHDEALEASDLEVIARAKRALTQEEEFSQSAGSEKRPLVVYALILLNVAGFVWELAHGTDTTDDRLLVDSGAFLASKIVNGEWWRLGSYMFLHAGVLHITLNLFAFYLFGPFVERTLGRARFLALYLLSGLAGSATLLFFQRVLHEDPAPAVGASGCVMGVVGATIAILARAWLRERAPVAGARLRLLVLMMGVQTVIDLTQEQISFKAHAAGLVSGMILGLLLVMTLRRPAAR
ncbi:MAG: rhomboid family intramembrane serine protease [Polyangiaceae bacterium]